MSVPKQMMNMKKAFYLIAALTGLALLSCNKEVEAPVVPSPEKGATHQVSIKASIVPGTRTSYADDKTFSWEANDSILIIAFSPDEEDIELVTLYAESAGPETVFSGECPDGYTLSNNAFYTAANSYIDAGEGLDKETHIFVYLPTFTYIDGDSENYYTAQSANPLSNLPLIGVKDEEGDTYSFYTFSGAAKFSFTDIPEGAAYFALEHSTERLSGQFTWNEDGVLANDSYRPGSYTRTVDGEEVTMSYSSSYVVYHFERPADGKGEVYMPLPVGKIPAGTTVSFYDEDLENVLYTRTIRADVPIERNKVTEVAPFSATSGEWTSIGEGAFYDLLPFYFMNSSVQTFAGVEFYTNETMPGVFRIQNPYPVAAEDREYTIKESVELPEYLDFTILKDGTVLYDDLHTGYMDEEAEEGDGDWFGGCPAWWGEDNSYNFVAKYQEDGTPELVILSPLYLYAHEDSYYYAYSSTTWRDLFVTIYFPGADLENQADLSCQVAFGELVDDEPAQPIGTVSVELGDSYSGAYLVIARNLEEAKELLAAGKGVEVSGSSDDVEVPFPADAPTGEYFAYAKGIPAEGFTENCALVFEADEEFEYYRRDEDRKLSLDDILGNYTASNYIRYDGKWSKKAVDLSLTVEEGDELQGYEIAFTDICPELIKAIASRNAEITPQPVYASFSYATGVVTIPTGQVAYTVTVKSLIGKTTTTDYTVGNVYGKAVTMYLTEPGVLYNKHNIGLWSKEDGEDVLAGNTNASTTFTRSQATASAPARFGHYNIGLLQSRREQSVSRYEGLYKAPGQPLRFNGTVPSKASKEGKLGR